MSTPSHVVVVGASAGGLSTAEALRRQGFTGRLTIVGAEPHPPYDRPPLSKQVLAGVWEPERARLRTEPDLSAVDAQWCLGDPAVAFDAATRSVRTRSGTTVSGDAVVLATGAAPLRLPGSPDLAGVHVLRTLDDALGLRAALTEGRRLVVVGEGVLGAEVAATARTLAMSVTLVGPQPRPLAAQLGPLVSGLLADLHREHGVELALGHAVDGLVGRHGRVTGVRLDGGRVLPADVVVVAIGAAPATAWLQGSGVPVDDGVVCDSRCRAADGVYAVGDVARWHHPGLGTSVRLENRTNATEAAQVVAANVLGEDRAYAPVPHYWTDQFDTKIQVFGLPSATDEITVVDGDPADRRFVVRCTRDGRVTGVIGWRMPKQTRLRRGEVADALAVVPTV
ncbi:NAD(P)/FAD-dependent oxidoreductase [Saccharomonospora azurea]|uniref:NAD(P)H-nitrite reductase n=1 Tax=Saccharomonospora azurea NA-128 TaxID=882081 RepID=H8GDP7_9PSEU|nr:FAD/NAD(P)-binding oxidoreductase [Saccharomonospora azurea]EHY87892.1 NAD(P)H-nitrite reductase [Saccharomonospora azurea NA-128]